MAKLHDKPIVKEDIEEYLAGYSDFSFEIAVQRQLSLLGFQTQHGGTYEDPATKKAREFDIRAIKEIPLGDNFIFRLCMSVECKNIRDYFPLVIHCTPRTLKEAYQELVWSRTETHHVPFHKRGFPLIVNGEKSVYLPCDPVGKSCDQIGRKDGKERELVSNDGDVFDKISQAINASYDLIKASHYAGSESMTVVSSVVPVLVIPDGRLWTIWYDKDGNIEEGPAPADSVSYFIGKEVTFNELSSNYLKSYRLTHLEIVTFNQLRSLVQRLMDDDRFSRKTLAEIATKS